MEIPEPEVGQVIQYGYLWQREDAQGREDSLKYRPCAIVLAVVPSRGEEHGTHVAVAPITHSPPDDPRSAVEIPPDVKKRLGLDDERSWIILTEINRFSWPGPDLVPLRARARLKEFIYGSLPKALINEMLRVLAMHIRAGRLKVVKRTE